MKKGFTLIELLIVVAIIAILAAIAVPNFLEAQTRAKVTRTKGEMRTLATAIESYYIDHNKPAPQSNNIAVPGNPFNPAYDPNDPTYKGTGTLTQAITTPIAYLSSYLFYDPFTTGGGVAIDERLYSYHPYQWIWSQPKPPSGGATIADSSAPSGIGVVDGTNFKNLYGGYRLLSVGPDKTYYNQATQSTTAKVRLPYDSTNGSISFGNVIRSQKEPEQTSFISSVAGQNNF